MLEEMKDDEELTKEYDETFDGDEKVAHALKMDKGTFSLEFATVKFDDILIPDSIKNGRRETYLGLTTSVGEMGILTPIHVMLSEGYTDWIDDGNSEESFKGYRYILLDGFRRIWAGLKNGLTQCNAIVWNFEDKDKGADLTNSLILILNKEQKRSWNEIWYFYKILESQSSFTPGTIEYLLQLEPGDAMKLKEIMTRADEFPDPKQDLLDNKKNLQQCFNALQKAMKEQDQLTKEDTQGIADLDEAEGIVEEAEDTKLSDDDVKEILDMSDNDLDLKEDDFDEMLQPNKPEVQKVGDRHPISPELKAETMQRDGYKCVCCGNGEYLPMRYKLAVLQSHHKISVANGGPDTADNIVTLCVSCHTLVHSLLWSGLKFGMKKEEFDALPEAEQTKLKNVMKIARADAEAAKRLGKTRKDLMGQNKHHSTFKMPGTDMKENAEAIKKYNTEKLEEDAS